MSTARFDLIREGQPVPPKFRMAAEAFHAHLDECLWCDTRPFALCQIGQALLHSVAEAEASLEAATRAAQ